MAPFSMPQIGKQPRLHPLRLLRRHTGIEQTAARHGVRRYGFPLPPIVSQLLLQRLDPRLPFAITLCHGCRTSM
jgi:hypothetical protein